MNTHKHWSNRLKDNMKETGRFFAEFGVPLGIATTAVLASCAVTAGIAASNSEHSLVAQEMHSLSAGLGTVGVLAGGYTSLFSIWCEKMMNKIDMADQQTAEKVRGIVEQVTGRKYPDPEEAIIDAAQDPRKTEALNSIIAGTPLEKKFMGMIEDARLSATSHVGPSSELESDQDTVRMAPA